MARSDPDYAIEEDREGLRALVVTGLWNDRVAEAFDAQMIDSLVLNYARGFRQRDLKFLDGLKVRGMRLLSRTLTDIGPLYSLAESLESLSIEVHESVALDLGRLPKLRSLSSDWHFVRDSFSVGGPNLTDLFLTFYDGSDLTPLTSSPKLSRLRLKSIPRLHSVDGVEEFSLLEELQLAAAPKLADIARLGDGRLDGSLLSLWIESCRSVKSLEPLSDFRNLRLLAVADCGDVHSLDPLRSLENLRRFLAWESTRVLDDDLSPLLSLPNLVELRMQSRKNYRPSVPSVQMVIEQRRTASAN